MKKLIKIFLICTLVFLALCITVSAETEGNFTYTVSGEKVTITGFPTDVGGEVIIPSAIGGYPVTAISASAFRDCALITKITVPDSVTSIGKGAFQGCNALEEITLPFVGKTNNSSGISSVFGYIFGYTTSSSSTGAVYQYDDYYYNYSGDKISEKYYYYIPSSLRTVTITRAEYIPFNAFYNCSNLTSIIIGDGVTTFYDHAFYNCSRLTSIEIPDSVTQIYGYAFYGCENLTGVYISDISAWCKIAFLDCYIDNGYSSYYGGAASANPLYYTKKLYLNDELVTNLVIPDDVTEIKQYAFYNCSSLTSIEIGDSVTTIGNYAFRDCDSLISAVIGDSVTTIGDYAFYGCDSLISAVIGDSVITIGKSAFDDCESLISVVIGDSVTTIGNSAFNNCSNLTSVVIPDSVTTIGEDAFYTYFTRLKSVFYEGDETQWKNISKGSGNSNLTSASVKYNSNGGKTEDVAYIVKENEVTVICANSGTLKELNIPSVIDDKPVTVIAESAFYNYKSLTSIEIPESVTKIGNNAFSNTAWYNNQPNGVVYAGKVLYKYKGTMPANTSIIVEEGTKGIAEEAFYNCDNLTSIEMPDSVTTIGSYAFYYCTGLTTVEVPDSVTTIGSYAFYGCTGLTSIEIPDSVITIGKGALGRCSSLEKITIPFVGSERGNSGTSDALFGYIFGTSSYTGSYAAKQYYTGSGYTTYYIPESLKRVVITDEEIISYGAFQNCSGLTSIEIPDSVSMLGNSAFNNCEGLTSVEIPDSVTTIGEDAFYNCTGLTTVEVPDSVTTIGEGALGGCSSLEELTIPFVGSERGNSGTSDALFGYIFGTSSYTGSYAVKQNYNSSEYATYYVPTSLKKVTVTDEKVIPYGAFSNCNHMSKIVIEGNPSAIMANCFTGFYNLFDVVVKAEKVKYVSSNIFEGSDFPTLYGYAGSTTETYAKSYNVEFIPLDYYEEYTLSGKAKSINNKVVVNVKVSDKVKDKHLHIALYDADGKQIDYIIVPTYDAFDEINVVFADNKSAKSAKLFLWESLVSLTPISSSVETEIIR